MNTDLATLAAASVSAYLAECGTLITPTLAGLLAVEAANAYTWAADGYSGAEVKAALIDAWTARA